MCRMPDLKLYVFDYNYSSWSMRAGVLLRASGLQFEEQALHLDDAGRASLGTLSPSKLLPMLEHGTLRVWDSLAIAEYVAELCPERALWPRDAHARAIARSASAEMHAGFMPLRNLLMMNIRARHPGTPRPPEVEANVARIKQLWTELRTRFGADGDFLCGAFGIVDAMYVPVVMRFRTYGVKLAGVCAAYADALLQHPAVQDWLVKAAAETKRVPAYELTRD